MNILTMATFSGLPNEAILEIWRRVLQAEDIKSFASSSKKIYALSGQVLLVWEHRTLKHAFSTFNNGGTRGQDSRISAAGLLKAIKMNSRVALHVYYISSAFSNTHYVPFKRLTSCIAMSRS